MFIQVRWDEASSIPRPERVSPWQIEPAVSPPPINPLPVHRPKRPRSNAVASLPESSAPTKEGLTSSCVQNLVGCMVILLMHVFYPILAAPKVTLETQQHALQRPLQTQDNVAPKSVFGDNSELDSAHKSSLRPSGFDLDKSTIGMQRKLGSDIWMRMNRPDGYSEMLSGYQPPNEGARNSQGFCSLPDQIAAGRPNFWHTVNAHYQDQQGNHNLFPGSWSMMPSSTGFGMNRQSYPMIQEVGGMSQSCTNTKFGNGVYAALPGRGIDRYPSGWFGHTTPGGRVDDAQPRVIKPQPLVLAHGEALKMKGNSCKLFGIHLDSPAKSEPLKSPPSVATPAAEKWMADGIDADKSPEPHKTPKQLGATQTQVDPVPERCPQASRGTQCKSQGGSTRSCKKVCFFSRYYYAKHLLCSFAMFQGYKRNLQSLFSFLAHHADIINGSLHHVRIYSLFELHGRFLPSERCGCLYALSKRIHLMLLWLHALARHMCGIFPQKYIFLA